MNATTIQMARDALKAAFEASNHLMKKSVKRRPEKVLFHGVRLWLDHP